MIYFYQHLPFYINPVIFSIGSFAVRWYSVMYLVAFAVFYLLIKYRIRKGEGNYKKEINNLILFYMESLACLLALDWDMFYFIISASIFKIRSRLFFPKVFKTVFPE